MIIEIFNSNMKVQINTLGGELYSIQNERCEEYLWQGDEKYWGQRSPNLFPYVGRLTEGKYRYAKTEYRMGIHGFIQDYDMAVYEKSAESVTLLAVSNAQTIEQYPFEFEYYITYALCGRKLTIEYRVVNKGGKTMYFGIGGHPGFRVPLEDGMRFEDYYLEFEETCQLVRLGFSEDCFLNGADKEYQLDGKQIPLRHDIFDQDAIVWKEMSKAILLKCKNGKKSVRVGYPDMSYLGIWHMPHTDAPYVCIEPWCSLPSRKDIIEDLETQENLIAVDAGKEYCNKWDIECMEETE